MKKGRRGTLTHDYKRNGTTTLFAALNVLEGTVIGRNMQCHRHQAFIRFLNILGREIPAGKQVHVVLDNYANHKKDKVREWLHRHPRWTFHFTPTSCLWLSTVEGFFAKLTRRRLKYGVFRSFIDLQAAINRLIAEHNKKEAIPLKWTALAKKESFGISRTQKVWVGTGFWNESSGLSPPPPSSCATVPLPLFDRSISSAGRASR